MCNQLIWRQCALSYHVSPQRESIHNWTNRVIKYVCLVEVQLIYLRLPKYRWPQVWWWFVNIKYLTKSWQDSQKLLTVMSTLADSWQVVRETKTESWVGVQLHYNSSRDVVVAGQQQQRFSFWFCRHGACSSSGGAFHLWGSFHRSFTVTAPCHQYITVIILIIKGTLPANQYKLSTNSSQECEIVHNSTKI